jgi:hypothetical protein
MKTRLPVIVIVALASVLAACSTGAGRSPASSSPVASPSSPPGSTSPAPTPTPIAADVASPEDAAALVIATDPRFEGAISLTSDIIGASKWWEAEALPDGAYRISLTIGWGDCPAGCINHHVWVFEVTAAGSLTLLEESGDAVPDSGLPD